MTRFYPTMKMDIIIDKEVDDMYNTHGHAGNLSRVAILENLKAIISSRSASKTELPVNIADFGTADGQASMSLVNEMIGVIQDDLGMEQTIVIYYNDQPFNDFNRLSRVLQGKGQKSGLKINKYVYPMIIPKTMYEQCLPDNSLDIAFSSVATHYLSKQVCQIKNGISIADADENELSLMREQAKTDWRDFVISRGRELKPGGCLVTMNISSDDYDDEAMPLENGTFSMGSFVTDMAREGVITQEEYLTTNFNSYYLRKPSDFKEPFTNDLHEVKELGLELVSVKSIKHFPRHPIFDIINKDEKERLAYSEKVVSMAYPWMYHVLYGGLSSSRSEDEKQVIIEDYFSRLQMYALSHPHHKPYLIFTEIVIKKEKQ